MRDELPDFLSLCQIGPSYLPHWKTPNYYMGQISRDPPFMSISRAFQYLLRDIVDETQSIEAYQWLGEEKFWQVCQRVFRGNLGRFFIFFERYNSTLATVGGNNNKKDHRWSWWVQFVRPIREKNAIFVIFSKFPLHKVPQHTATVKSRQEINFFKLEAV